MEFHIILIILIVAILLILVAHGVWSSRREKSQLFKSANTFTYDSRSENRDLLDQQVAPQLAENVPHTASHNANHTVSIAETENPPLQTSSNAQTQPPVSLEQAVSNIRITLPQQSSQQLSQRITSETASAVGATSSQRSDPLSRSSLLNRTIADLEQEIDSEEGLNTSSSSILREELAKMTQHKKVITAEPPLETLADQAEAAPISPQHTAETLRVQLNPQQVVTQTDTPQAVEPTLEAEKIDVKKEAETEQPTSLLLYVVAPNNQHFHGTQVVQALDSLGFFFGQHLLYHRHLDMNSNSPILFSVANMLNPGIFDLEHIADFRTAGLVLFMHLPSLGSDLANFRLLLRAAQTLAEQLGGQVLDDQRQPFDENAKNRYLGLIQ